MSTPLTELYKLWDKLGNVPVYHGPSDEDEEATPGEPQFELDTIEEPFHVFSAGTPRETIWHWFESQNPNFIIGEVQEGIHRTEDGEPFKYVRT